MDSIDMNGEMSQMNIFIFTYRNELKKNNVHIFIKYRYFGNLVIWSYSKIIL